MSSVKILQAILIIMILMLHLEAVLFNNSNAASCVQKERRALLNMKKAFVDYYGLLSSWGSSPDCCHWRGVLCDPQTGHVQKLDLHGDYYERIRQPLRGEISPSLLELQYLKYLNLSYNDFNGSEIPKFCGSLIKLRYLDLSHSSFGGKVPIELGKLSHLRVLNLFSNDLVGSIPSHLANLSCLQKLGLNSNHLVGYIPCRLGNLTSLETLWIGGNYDLKIDGIEWLSNLQSLTSLDLSDVSNLNYYNNMLPIIGMLQNLRELWLRNCSLTYINILSTSPPHLNFSTLSLLVLNDNKLTTSIFPWLFNFSSNLHTLALRNNHLGGPFPDDFGKNMNSLVAVDLYGNELDGTISDIHFGNLTKLQFISLSGNNLSFKFSNHWIPPFQLKVLELSNCELGPGFPKWLRTQNNLQVLYVYQAEINDSVPEWFWRLVQRVDYLGIGNSNLKGTIPDLPLEFTPSVIWLASNQIEGSLPPFLLKSVYLDISGNQISRFILSCDKGTSAYVENLEVLNLSGNNISRELPGCWDHFKSLKILDLSNNQLSGMIPNSMGSLTQLQHLVLRNNCFSGRLTSLENATKLMMLDLGENELLGPIPPSWPRDNLKELQILSLRMNKLDGDLPSHLCYFTKLRVLDLSSNRLTGPIPSCVDNLVAMAKKHVTDDLISFMVFNKKGKPVAFNSFNWYLHMVWKGTERVYIDRYWLVNIDLSSNQLVGEMPNGIGKLVELRFLNLSTNKLSGKIISEMGRLKSLEALDLSGNRFQGEIPPSLVDISSLNTLNLSNNNLSGDIPRGTQLQSFGASSYEGNPYLRGRPLDKLCASEDHPLVSGTQAKQVGDEDDPFMKGFYESLGVGFAVGFWMVFGSLLVNRSWRHAYFNFFNNLADSIYVTTMLLVARWLTWLRN